MVKVRRGIRVRPKKKGLKGDGFFDGLKKLTDLSYIFGTPKTPIIADKTAPPPQATQETTGIPDKAILKTIADNSYKATSDEMAPVPGFTLKEKTPTLVFYQKDGENIMVIGVRGTADFRDFRAWFSTAFSVIPDSQRFKEDLATITEFQNRFPVSSFTYYATGHSLGGTLIDELIKRGMVKEARTYNPAIETSDIPNVELSKKNKRIYADGDPLYLLQGRFDNPTEVRPSYKYYPSSVADFLPGYDKYKQHVLANPVFVGGETPFYHLQGAGLLDDFKKGIEKVTGKLPERAVLSPEQQADARRRQHIQDVDKQREKMVAQKKQIAIDDMMSYAQHPNVLKTIYAREGADNPKDYLARVVEKAKKRAEEFYPY